MMRKVLAFAALGLALSVTAASAQRGGGGQGRGGQRGGFGGGGLQLLTIKEVQTELKMTEPQIAKVGEKQTEMRSKMQEIFQGGGGGQPSPEERQQMMAKIQEMQTKAVADVLDSKQTKRFHQLELQQMGANALTRKEVADELKITEDQKKQMQELRQKQMEEMRNSGFDFQNASPEERQAFMKKMQDAQKATGEKIIALLTAAQKKQWQDMQGEPFKFPPMQFGGPGRRPGGAGGNPPPPPVA